MLARLLLRLEIKAILAYFGPLLSANRCLGSLGDVLSRDWSFSVGRCLRLWRGIVELRRCHPWSHTY